MRWLAFAVGLIVAWWLVYRMLFWYKLRLWRRHFAPIEVGSEPEIGVMRGLYDWQARGEL